MTSRLRKVEHIVVFDMSGEMVAGRKEEPFWYMYQKEYFFGNKKLREVKQTSRPLEMKKSTLETLRRRTDRLLTNSFSYEEVENQPEWLDVNIDGGSTISYIGEHKEMFLQKVMNKSRRAS